MYKKELLKKYKEIEKLRNKIKKNKKAMKYYTLLKKQNTNDILYSWLFENDNLLNEDLRSLEIYDPSYVFEILSCYESELFSICRKVKNG